MAVNAFIARLSIKNSDRIARLLIPVQMLSSVIDFLYPKKDNYIVCGSNTGEYFSGSPKAFYEYVTVHHPEFKIFHYHPFRKKNSPWETLSYMIHFFPIYYSARFLVSSHPPNDFFPFVWWSRRKCVINTWHGFGIKAMFFADSGDTGDKRKIVKLNEKTTYFLVSSKLESALKAKTHMVNPRKFLYIGQPRNDRLLEPGPKTCLRTTFKTLPEYKKIILYGPTYRREKPTLFFPFEDFELEQFNRFLEEEKIIILLRGHVYAKGSPDDFFGDRILDLSHDVLEDEYDILPEIDILITDYSSLYTTFLLLNRPMIFVPYDREEYETGRGLLLDDYDFWTPGRKVSTYHEFIDALKEILSGNDIFASKREDVRKIFHYNQNGNTSEKLLAVMNEVSGQKNH